MAEKRMFAKAIVESDAFLDMPLSTQALYFHLGMYADDDGFVNGPSRVQRMIGANADDLNLLIAKGFLIPFPSGVVVVKHWKINNYIQKDRYKETTYGEEKAMLYVKKNRSYSLEPDSEIIECKQNVYNLDTQNSKDKNSIEKISTAQCIQAAAVSAAFDAAEVVGLYNAICVSFRPVHSVSAGCADLLSEKMGKYTIDDFQAAFRAVQGSSFLRSRGRNAWMGLEWILKDDHIEKILSGAYTDHNQFGDMDQRPAESDKEMFEYLAGKNDNLI